MTYELELFVRLVIPDNIALTAKHTLDKMGYDVDIEREDYYKFIIEGSEDISEELGKVDIIVNANKHKFTVKKAGDKLEKESCVRVIVKDIENPGVGLLKTLRERLGFNQIEHVEKGTLWKLYTDKETAKEITEKLLANKHYQEYTLD